MNLKTLSSPDLVSKIKELASEERRLTAEVLRYLQEIDHRRAYLDYGCTSLWQFCIKILHYSEGSTHRRIQSMKVLRDHPELNEAVEQGSLTLSTLAQAAPLELPKDQKREFLLSLQNQSTREVERQVREIRPLPVTQEKERVINGNQVEIKLVLSEDLRQKLEQLKERLGKKISGKLNPTYAELIEYLATKELSRAAPPPPAPEVRRSVTQKMRAYLLHQAQHQCTHVDPKTKERCETKRGLEIDHLTPKARGGTNAEENLRVLCKIHNLHAAQMIFGEAHMNKYWKRP